MEVPKTDRRIAQARKLFNDDVTRRTASTAGAVEPAGAEAHGRLARWIV